MARQFGKQHLSVRAGFNRWQRQGCEVGQDVLGAGRGAGHTLISLVRCSPIGQMQDKKLRIAFGHQDFVFTA
jgi:hypothetical protein